MGLTRIAFLGLLGLAQLCLAQDLFDVLNQQSDLSSFRATLSLVPSLALTLANASDITILAPIDDAFVALPPNSTEARFVANRNIDGLGALLAYHALRASYPSSNVTNTPYYVPTFLDSSFNVANIAIANVTGGQSVGVVRNGSDVSFLSGELAYATVTKADLTATGRNGGTITIHKVDDLLRLPTNASTTLPSVPEALAAAGAMLAASGKPNLLAEVDVLSDTTVFVPSDQAFQAAGRAIMSPDADAALLRRVLLYHVVPGRVMFASGAGNVSLATEDADGKKLTMTVVDEDVYVDSAKVLVPNIILAGGVAHIIDTVLNPDAAEIDRASIDPTASPTPAFSSASLVAVTPYASEVTPTTTLTVPAVLTTGPVVSETSTATANATASVAAAALVPTTARQLGVVVVCLVVGAFLS